MEHPVSKGASPDVYKRETVYQNHDEGPEKNRGIVMKYTCILLAGIFFLFSEVSHAKLAGYNLILVHGFKSDDLELKPNDDEITILRQTYWVDMWNDIAEYRIVWGSQHRLEEGVSEFVARQVQELIDIEACRDGCIIATHSTGDLVAKYLYENMEDWFGEDVEDKFKIVAFFDFAGASGGTELSELAIDAASGSLGSLAQAAVEFALSITADSGSGDAGVMNDLLPSTARNLIANDFDIPHIRNVGAKDASFSDAFISGGNDSVVPHHSSCGAAEALSYDECAHHIDSRGEIGEFFGPERYLRMHYVLLVGNTIDHSDTIQNDVSNSILSYVVNDIILPTKTVHFDVNITKEPGLIFGETTYLTIEQSGTISMSRSIMQALGTSRSSFRQNIATTSPYEYKLEIVGTDQKSYAIDTVSSNNEALAKEADTTDISPTDRATAHSIMESEQRTYASSESLDSVSPNSVATFQARNTADRQMTNQTSLAQQGIHQPSPLPRIRARPHSTDSEAAPQYAVSTTEATNTKKDFQRGESSESMLSAPEDPAYAAQHAVDAGIGSEETLWDEEDNPVRDRSIYFMDITSELEFHSSEN